MHEARPFGPLHTVENGTNLLGFPQVPLSKPPSVSGSVSFEPVPDSLIPTLRRRQANPGGQPASQPSLSHKSRARSTSMQPLPNKIKTNCPLAGTYACVGSENEKPFLYEEELIYCLHFPVTQSPPLRTKAERLSVVEATGYRNLTCPRCPPTPSRVWGGLWLPR